MLEKNASPLAVTEALQAVHEAMDDFSANDFDADWAFLDLALTLEKCLNQEQDWLSDFRTVGLKELPEQFRSFYEALVLFQAFWHFMDAFTYDGLLSSVYNFTGKEIAATRCILSGENHPFSQLVEAFYRLTSQFIPEAPEENWVSLNQDSDPWGMLSAAEQDRICAIEEALAEVIPDMMDFVVQKIRDAQQGMMMKQRPDGHGHP